MALSQVQCLDDNHVNPRTHESKPEFFYCEDQRLALEALLRDGREAFLKHLEARGLRVFLSDPELETFVGAAEPYDPGSELFPENAGDGESPLSLHYWPELSDTSTPQLDLGWPDSESYRGVTRTTVYMQPPLDGQAHIKEVVRKMIAQAQKVIAVVMDVFTDVDIFRDLLDAGFKRRVSVYILLEHAMLPHFLSMCRRANMHAGHLKHLRVRCTEGTEFHTRSCTKVKGRMGHRFMFIDGDKAVSGSYSFTWMSSRLDRNLITVVTGQAVEAFDRLFRFLYATSRSVDLQEVATEPEPEPEPLPQPTAVVLTSAALARKLHNPKYALVAVANPTVSSEHNSPKEPLNAENSKNPAVQETNKKRQKRANTQDVPPLHPGLADLEKASLIAYLPTWPEPDPPSDVIGFINIRDVNKPTQVHLQRSEMFETSQAIRFSSPISVPKETLPEVAKPRQLTVKYEEVNKPLPAQHKTKARESLVDCVQSEQLSTESADIKCNNGETTKQKTPASGKTSGPAKNTSALVPEYNQHSSTPTIQDGGYTTPHGSHTPPHFRSKAVNDQGPLYSTHTVTTNSIKPQSLSGSNTKKEVETNLNTQSVVVHGTHTPESSGTESPQLHVPSDSQSKVEQHTKERTGLPLTNSHTQGVHTATFLSENNHIPVTTSITSLSSIVSSSTPAVHSPIPSSTASLLTPAPPIPKPRTVQLVIKQGATSDVQNMPEISVVRNDSLASTGSLQFQHNTYVANMVQTPLKKKPQTLPELHNSKTEPQRDTENTGNPEVAPQQEQSVASQETKGEEAVGLHTRAKPQAQSDVLITDAPKADSGNVEEIIPKEADPKSLTSTDCTITSKTQTDQTATMQPDTEAPEKTPIDCESTQVPNEINNNRAQHNIYQDPQRISHCEMNPQDNGPLETVNLLTVSTHTPVSNSDISNESADDGTVNQPDNLTLTSALRTDDKPNVTKRNTHTNTTSEDSQQTLKPRGSSHIPEKPLRLHLSDTHFRDQRSTAPERELRSLSALVRTPTPDGFTSHTPTSDSRTHTPDSWSFTPEFETPTTDVSDWCVPPGEASTLSTTSEEYYECSDSPSHNLVSDCVDYHNHKTTEDHFSFTHTNTPNVTVITTTSTCPAYINHSTHPTVLDTADKNKSNSETQILPEPVGVFLSSSVLAKKVQIRGEEETVNEKSGKEEDEKGKNAAERRTGQNSQKTERKGSENAEKTVAHSKQGIDLTEIVGRDKVSQPQGPKRKNSLNKSAAESLVDGGVTLGKSTNEGTNPKRASGVDKRDGPQPTRDSNGQKLLHTPPKLSQGQQQQESGLSTPSQPPRPPRPLLVTQPSGTRPWRGYQLNQAETKALHSGFQVLDNTSSQHRPLSKPPPQLVLGAARSASGQKQAKVSHSQQSHLHQQPLVAQRRARDGQSQNEHAHIKPQSSFLLTHSKSQPSPSQNQTASVPEARRQEEGRSPFTITFGRLYSLKGLKDKMSKFPAQSKRGSTSSPLQRRKSTN